MTRPSPKTLNPLDRLAELAATEANRRESARAANRARFPQLAEACDVLGARLEWARDAQGEIGKIKPDPAHWVSVSADVLSDLRDYYTHFGGKR